MIDIIVDHRENHKLHTYFNSNGGIDMVCGSPCKSLNVTTPSISFPTQDSLHINLKV